MEVKLRAGRYMIPVSMTRNGKRIEFKFPYQPTLKDEIKAMQGSKWNPDRKVWSIADTPRNDFQLKYLMGQDPYGRFEKPEVELTNVFRPLYDHQLDMIRFALTYHYCILACEMGTGKTLAAI